MKKCPACSADIQEWLNKFKDRLKVYLDRLYFDENKTSYKQDEHGFYIPGHVFYELEAKKARERCPRCGFKFPLEEDVQWGPI